MCWDSVENISSIIPLCVYQGSCWTNISLQSGVTVVGGDLVQELGVPEDHVGVQEVGPSSRHLKFRCVNGEFRV